MFFSNRNENQPWIMVNFYEPKLVSGVMTQGSPDSARWIEQYYVYLSLDGVNFSPYTESDADKTPYLFTGNTDSATPVRGLFNHDIIAQYVKIVPVKASAGGIGLRFTVVGCTPNVPPPVRPTPSESTATPEPGHTGVPTQPNSKLVYVVHQIVSVLT